LFWLTLQKSHYSNISYTVNIIRLYTKDLYQIINTHCQTIINFTIIKSSLVNHWYWSAILPITSTEWSQEPLHQTRHRVSFLSSTPASSFTFLIMEKWIKFKNDTDNFFSRWHLFSPILQKVKYHMVDCYRFSPLMVFIFV
jgi:hypothetical protein